LSRSQVFVLRPLNDEALKAIAKQALEDEKRGLGGRGLVLNAEAEDFLIQYADGDARKVLNALALAADLCEETAVTLELVQQAVQQKTPRYDQSGEEHYDLISALHKSVRNSDPDAALYWLARMLAGGEDPLFLARRLARMASEDIGMADPQALPIALAAWQAFERMGPPEGELSLAQATVYLASAPKSNAVYVAFDAAKRDVESTRNDPVPLHLRNAVTGLMKELGYGKNYQYAHDRKEGTTEMQCLPDNLKGRTYYRPSEHGQEPAVRQRLQAWRALRQEREDE